MLCARVKNAQVIAKRQASCKKCVHKLLTGCVHRLCSHCLFQAVETACSKLDGTIRPNCCFKKRLHTLCAF